MRGAGHEGLAGVLPPRRRGRLACGAGASGWKHGLRSREAVAMRKAANALAREARKAAQALRDPLTRDDD